MAIHLSPGVLLIYDLAYECGMFQRSPQSFDITTQGPYKLSSFGDAGLTNQRPALWSCDFQIKASDLSN